MSGMSTHNITKAAMEDYVSSVYRVWASYWKPKPESRYGQSFPTFLGERVISDFGLPSNMQTGGGS